MLGIGDACDDVDVDERVDGKDLTVEARTRTVAVDMRTKNRTTRSRQQNDKESKR